MQVIQEVKSASDQEIHKILTDILTVLVSGGVMDTTNTQRLIAITMLGRCPEPLLSAIITAWRIQGESMQQIAAAALVLRAFANQVTLADNHAVDIVGTGGDGANLFNVSTAASFVVATAGVPVAKHGSTGVSSSSGASDVLSSMGVSLQLTPEQIAQSVSQHHIGFMFAPNHHPAMRYAKNVRGLLKIRTIFNILGPLTNPASVPYTVLGVYHDKLCEKLAGAMGQLGSRHVWAVCAKDGLDEISLAAPTKVAEFNHGKLTTFTITPEDAGIQRQSLDGLTVLSPQESFALIQQALSGNLTNLVALKAADMIALNAGAALYVAGKVDNYQAGVSLAKEIIQSGKALQKIHDFAKFTQDCTNLTT